LKLANYYSIINSSKLRLMLIFSFILSESDIKTKVKHPTSKILVHSYVNRLVVPAIKGSI